MVMVMVMPTWDDAPDEPLRSVRLGSSKCPILSMRCTALHPIVCGVLILGHIMYTSSYVWVVIERLLQDRLHARTHWQCIQPIATTKKQRGDEQEPPMRPSTPQEKAHRYGNPATSPKSGETNCRRSNPASMRGWKTGSLTTCFIRLRTKKSRKYSVCQGNCRCLNSGDGVIYSTLRSTYIPWSRLKRQIQYSTVQLSSFQGSWRPGYPGASLVLPKFWT